MYGCWKSDIIPHFYLLVYILYFLRLRQGGNAVTQNLQGLTNIIAKPKSKQDYKKEEQKL